MKSHDLTKKWTNVKHAPPGKGSCGLTVDMSREIKHELNLINCKNRCNYTATTLCEAE